MRLKYLLNVKIFKGGISCALFLYFVFFLPQTVLGEEFEYFEGEALIQGGLSTESSARLMDPIVVDWNGDGLSDIIVGAPGLGIGDNRNTGALYILLGKQQRDWSQSLDLSLLESFDYRFEGTQLNGMLGLVLDSGDLNGDGVADIVVSEPGGNGSVYVIYGSKSLEAGNYRIDDKRVSDLVFYSDQRASLLGSKFCLGDFNGDGLDDLAMASLNLDQHGRVLSSDMTIIASRRSWPERFQKISGKLLGKTRLSRPISGNVRALHSCVAGDFNDDHVMDIALSLSIDSYQRQQGVGSVSIIYSPLKSSGGSIDLSQKNPTWGVKLFGDQINAFMGHALASGDFTGDGRTDLAIAEPGRLNRGPQREGRVILLQGGQMPSESGVIVDGLILTGTGAGFGEHLQSLDINGDKRSDLIIGQPNADSHAGVKTGKLSVYFGGPHLSGALEENRGPDVVLAGAEFMRLGHGGGIGDIDGDEKLEWILRSPEDPLQRESTGSLVIAKDPGSFELQAELPDKSPIIIAPSQGGGISSIAHVVRYKDKTYLAWLSPGGLGQRSVICWFEQGKEIPRAFSQADSCDQAFVGPENIKITAFSLDDMDQDGNPELILAMPEMEWEKGRGVVAAISLPEQLEKAVSLNFDYARLTKSAWVYVLENEKEARFGEKFMLHDFDGDGLSELLISAPWRTVEGARSGSLFMVKGQAKRPKQVYSLGSAKTKQFVGLGDEELASDWAVIDFNLDGVDDLVILGQDFSTSRSESYETAYVVYSPHLLSEKAYNPLSPGLGALKILAPKSQARLRIISSSEDLNGDGKADLLLMSPNYRSGLQRVGKIFSLNSTPDRKSGEISLENESMSDFSLSPNRNERFLEAQLALISGQTKLLLATEHLQAAGRVDAYLIDAPKSGVWHGNLSTRGMKMQRIALAKEILTKFIIFKRHDLAESEDSVWLLHPGDGAVRSGEGIVRPLKKRSLSQ